MTVLDVQFTKLPGWSRAASYFFIASHAAEYSMARSDQDSIRSAGGASSLIRNAGVEEVGSLNLRECGEHYPYDDILGGAYEASGYFEAYRMFLVVESAVKEDYAFHLGCDTVHVPEGIAYHDALICTR
eukprot:1155550-Pelagomonas_calceolata.AAC.2